MTVLSKNFTKVLKRFNGNNNGGARSRDFGGGSTGVPTPRRNTASNAGNFNAGSRNKGIQCRECEGFGHIQAECANTLKKKNKSLNATWSDGDSDGSREDDSDLVAFASRTDNAGGEGDAGSSKNTEGVSGSVPTLTYESSDDEDLTEDAMIETYRLIHAKWTELTKSYEKISAQNQQLNNEKNNLQKHNSELESKLKESQSSVTTLNAELEKMKKLVKMLNSGSSKLDEILSAGRTEKEHFGLGYTGQTGSGQTVFVKGTSSGTNEEKDVKGKRPTATPIKTPAVMKLEGLVVYHLEEHQAEEEEGIGFQSVITVTNEVI